MVREKVGNRATLVFGLISRRKINV